MSNPIDISEERYHWLSANFHIDEFSVSSSHPNLAKEVTFDLTDFYNLKILALECLQPIRKKFGRIFVTSGKRSQALNSAVKGSYASDHLTGSAADVHICNFSHDHVFKWIIKGSTIPYRQVILYPEAKFIHISSNSPQKELKHEALVFQNKSYVTWKDYFKNG